MVEPIVLCPRCRTRYGEVESVIQEPAAPTMHEDTPLEATIVYTLKCPDCGCLWEHPLPNLRCE